MPSFSLGCAPRRAVTPEAALREVCEERALPMRIVGGRDHLDVVVAGRPLRLQIDTGGNALGIVVYRSAITRAGLGDPSSWPRWFEANGRRITLPTEARWASLEDESPEARASSVHPFKVRKDEADGQIGAGFLSHFVVCLDAARGRLGLLEKGAVRIQGDGIPLGMLPDRQTGALYPFVRTSLGALLVDSGPPAGFLENERVPPDAAVEPLACGDADTISGSYRGERMAAFDLAPFGPMVVATRDDGTFVSIFGRRSDLVPTGAVGNDVLRRHRVLLDYEGARMFLEPAGQPDPSLRAARVCVSLEYAEDGCPHVTRTDDRSGLRVGDVLVRARGLDLCAATSEAVIGALAGDGVVPIRVRRGGAEVDVLATGRALFARAPRP